MDISQAWNHQTKWAEYKQTRGNAVSIRICQYGTDLLTTGQGLHRSPTAVRQRHLSKDAEVQIPTLDPC